LKVFINGRFLSHSLTGVERYALEMVRAIDGLVSSGEAPEPFGQAEWCVLTPPNASEAPPLAAIKTQQIGRLTGHIWDQIDLAWAARTGTLLSFANSGPVAHRDHTVIIHDAQVFRRPDFFSSSYVLVHRTLDRILARTAHIGTVSEFSRAELAAVLKVSHSSIGVFPNSADHFAATRPDYSILERLGLESRKFFLTVGSMTKNKNIQLAIDAARCLDRPDIPLVVVGGNNQQVFGGIKPVADPGVIRAGRLPDNQIAALYMQALAFIFPSLYEGFGVPPLEAMIFGCPVIASSAGAVRETCGDAAMYFDPLSATELADRLRERLAGGPISEIERQRQLVRLARYSWRNSAVLLLQSLKNELEARGRHDLCLT
jgi:glycosyltransferase involved in cell wall biosynthesis